jgi:hypothetical protein
MKLKIKFTVIKRYSKKHFFSENFLRTYQGFTFFASLPLLLPLSLSCLFLCFYLCLCLCICLCLSLCLCIWIILWLYLFLLFWLCLCLCLCLCYCLFLCLCLYLLLFPCFCHCFVLSLILFSMIQVNVFNFYNCWHFNLFLVFTAVNHNTKKHGADYSGNASPGKRGTSQLLTSLHSSGDTRHITAYSSMTTISFSFEWWFWLYKKITSPLSLC